MAYHDIPCGIDSVSIHDSVLVLAEENMGVFFNLKGDING